MRAREARPGEADVGVCVSPVVPRVAAAEGDVLHLEEVTTSVVLKVNEKKKRNEANRRLNVYLSQCIWPYFIQGVVFILQAHDQFHSLQTDLQLTQRGRPHVDRPLPGYRNLRGTGTARSHTSNRWEQKIFLFMGLVFFFFSLPMLTFCMAAQRMPLPW